MPPLPAVPNVMHFDVDGFISAQAFRWGIDFSYTGAPPTPAGALAISTTVNNALSHISSDTAMNTQYTQVTGTDLASASGASGTSAVTITGGQSTANDSALLAVRVGFRLARRYRGGHPAVYLPGFGSSYHSGNTLWANSALTLLATDWPAFITAAVAASSSGTTLGNHVSISYFQGFHTVTEASGRVRNVPTPRTTPLVDVVGGYTISALISTQRRRGGR